MVSARKIGLELLAAEMEMLGDMVQGVATTVAHYAQVQPGILREAVPLVERLQQQVGWCRRVVKRLLQLKDDSVLNQGKRDDMVTKQEASNGTK